MFSYIYVHEKTVSSDSHWPSRHMQVGIGSVASFSQLIIQFNCSISFLRQTYLQSHLKKSGSQKTTVDTE